MAVPAERREQEGRHRTTIGGRLRHPLIRQGEGPAAAHDRIHREQVDQRRRLDRIQAETVVESAPTRGTAAGDERKLRGIPAIGRGVAGCIPGTNPALAADAADRLVRHSCRGCDDAERQPFGARLTDRGFEG